MQNWKRLLNHWVEFPVTLGTILQDIFPKLEEYAKILHEEGGYLSLPFFRWSNFFLEEVKLQSHNHSVALQKYLDQTSFSWASSSNWSRASKGAFQISKISVPQNCCCSCLQFFALLIYVKKGSVLLSNIREILQHTFFSGISRNTELLPKRPASGSYWKTTWSLQFLNKTFHLSLWMLKIKVCNFVNYNRKYQGHYLSWLCIKYRPPQNAFKQEQETAHCSWGWDLPIRPRLNACQSPSYLTWKQLISICSQEMAL